MFLPEEWLCIVYDTLISLVVFISEENRPIIWQSVRVSSKAMVLSCDEASLCSVVCARLVMTSVSVPTK